MRKKHMKEEVVSRERERERERESGKNKKRQKKMKNIIGEIKKSSKVKFSCNYKTFKNSEKIEWWKW